MIIQDIYKTRTSEVCKVGPRATSMDLMNIEESKEDEGVE
jgi:hypothetical protein